jgi:hypothetical protein
VKFRSRGSRCFRGSRIREAQGGSLAGCFGCFSYWGFLDLTTLFLGTFNSGLNEGSLEGHDELFWNHSFGHVMSWAKLWSVGEAGADKATRKCQN